MLLIKAMFFTSYLSDGISFKLTKYKQKGR